MLLTKTLPLCFAIIFSANARAADIFVEKAEGVDLSKDQSREITAMVKRSVRRLQEHTLITTKEQADYTLQPSITRRGDDLLLRIEKLKSGNVVAVSEEPLGRVNASRDQAFNATEAVLQDDRLMNGVDHMIYARDPNMKELNGNKSANFVNEPSQRERLVPNEESVSGATTSAFESASPADSNSASQSHNQFGSDLGRGDVRAPSPIFHRRDNSGTYQVGIGPAFGFGLGGSQVMTNVNAGYSHPINDRFAVKGFGDLNLSLGADQARFLNFAVAGEYDLTANTFIGGRPYLDANAGYAFVRDNEAVTENAPALGAGAGFRFAANEVNMDVSLHYTALTTKIPAGNPSVLGLRAALNF